VFDTGHLAPGSVTQGDIPDHDVAIG